MNEIIIALLSFIGGGGLTYIISARAQKRTANSEADVKELEVIEKKQDSMKLLLEVLDGQNVQIMQLKINQRELEIKINHLERKQDELVKENNKLKEIINKKS